MGRLKDGRLWLGNENPPDWMLGLIVWIDGLDAGALIAGWLYCKGAGLLACASKIQPPKKLNKEAIVIHTRIPRFNIFIDAAFRFINFKNP